MLKNKGSEFSGLSLPELPMGVKERVKEPLEKKLEDSRQLLNQWIGENCYVSCSFGKDSMLLLFLALEQRKDVPVVFVNTGVDYRETLQFKEQICQAWNLNLIELHPEITFFDVMNRVKERRGVMDDGSKSSNICCYHLKEKPLLLLTRERGFTHCFTGITAIESRKRAWTAYSHGDYYYVKKQEIHKVHPILYWQPQEVLQFSKQHSIPVNPVYKKYGIPRTGCQCCTCYKGWREQLSRVNPKLYKIILERYFHQKVLDGKLLSEGHVTESVC